MKFVILFFLFINSIISLKAQDWIRTYGNSYWADDIIEDYDKGYIILGTKTNAKYGWIIKTDINGNKIWDKHLGRNGQYLCFPNNIEKTIDNGYIIAGTITKYNNQQDAFIMKLNTCGELEWCRDIYTPTIPDDIGIRAKPTADGGYIFLGLLQDTSQTHRIHLYKFNNLGDLMWHQYCPPDSLLFNEEAVDVLVCPDGFIVTGDCYYPDPGQPPGTGWHRSYFLKTDTLGNMIWRLPYGITDYYYGYAATSIRNIIGKIYSLVVHEENGVDKGALLKIGTNGDPYYNKDVFSFNSGLSTVNWLSDTLLIIGGGWGINGSPHPIMIKTDTFGNVLSYREFQSNAYSFKSTAKTFDSKFISISTDFTDTIKIYAYKVNSELEDDSIYTNPYIYDSLCLHPILSDSIDPDCGLIVNVEEPLIKPETHQLKVFPNPAASSVMVVFPKYLIRQNHMPGMMATTVYHQWTSTRLEIYDLKGSHLLSKEIPKNMEQLEMDISSWPPDMYYFRLVYKNETVAGEKVVKQ
jgi:hypothetical protein